jgi:DNA polymerase I-like protein with 3'-5' exonuclease and polymerase domains
MSADHCKAMVRRLRDSYKGVWEFKTELDRALEGGETIYNYMGRPIYFENPEDVYMKGFNRLIQGSGSDILQQAAFDITQDPYINEAIKPLLLVHDELVSEIDLEKVSVTFATFAINKHMTKFNLGDLSLSTEGGAGHEWKK